MCIAVVIAALAAPSDAEMAERESGTTAGPVGAVVMAAGGDVGERAGVLDGAVIG
jgi:hypothetical protein